jgi:hypothetical protein
MNLTVFIFLKGDNHHLLPLLYDILCPHCLLSAKLVTFRLVYTVTKKPWCKEEKEKNTGNDSQLI